MTFWASAGQEQAYLQAGIRGPGQNPGFLVEIGAKRTTFARFCSLLLTFTRFYDTFVTFAGIPGPILGFPDPESGVKDEKVPFCAKELFCHFSPFCALCHF